MSEKPKDDKYANINQEQARYVMMSHLNQTALLYRDLLRIILELKRLPTMRAGVIQSIDEDTIM